MYDQFMEGNIQGALETQRTILNIRDIIKQGPTVPILHAILELRGVDAGMPKRPYLPVLPEVKHKIAAQLRELNLI